MVAQIQGSLQIGWKYITEDGNATMEEIVINCKIRLLEDVECDFSDNIMPAGTLGFVIEIYENPLGYAVDFAIPSEDVAGGFRYENVILNPGQFTVV
jgi:hypothetical protein